MSGRKCTKLTTPNNRCGSAKIFIHLLSSPPTPPHYSHIPTMTYHSKGQWDPMDGADSEHLELDKDDPLYDEEAADNKYILTTAEDAIPADGEDPTLMDGITDRKVYGPMLTLAEFKLQVAEAVKEYFDASDADEVLRGINELKCRDFHPEVVKKSISLSLDKGPREREMISKLLTHLHPTPLADSDMEAGFELLLDSLDDLCIDCPDAKSMVGSFLARAVVDEVLPPAFLSNRNNSHPGDEVVEKAVGLLSREHCTARLEHVWGPGDGRPVTELKEVMDQLLEVSLVIMYLCGGADGDRYGMVDRPLLQ